VPFASIPDADAALRASQGIDGPSGGGGGPGVVLEACEGEQGLKLIEHARALNLEGIVSKRMDSRYRSGPSRDWWKIKNPEYERR
jgi:hypothetical protein